MSRRDATGILVLLAILALVSGQGSSFALVATETAFGWMGAGIALGAIIAYGHRIWPVVLAGLLAGGLIGGVEPLTAASVAAANTAICLAISYAFRKLSFRTSLENPRDVLGLIICLIPSAGLISALAGNLILVLLGTPTPYMPSMSTILWWNGYMMSGLIFCPLIVSWSHRSIETIHEGRHGELIALAVLTVVLSMITMLPSVPYAMQLGTVPSSFALAVWAALRFNIRVATALVSFVVGTGLIAATFGHSVLNFLDPRGQWAVLSLFALFFATTSLVLSAIEARRSRAEQKLRASEQRLRDIAEGTTDFFWETDKDLRITYVSERVEEIFAQAAKDLIGIPFYKQKLGQVDEVHWRQLSDCLSTRTTFRDLDIKIKTPKGDTRFFQLSGKPAHDSYGRFQGFRGSGREVTAQREAEELLFQAQKMETVGQLTGGVAHDFNNLLAVIMGNLELVDEVAGGNRKVAELVGRSLEATKRGATLIQRLLAFSRRQSLSPEVVSINQLLNDLNLMLERTVGASLEIEMRLSPDLWPVHVDPVQLETALLNLAVNARDAMPDGGRLVIESRNVTLETSRMTMFDSIDAGRYVALSVRDTGIGMTRDVMKRVFEPFFTTKESGGGSGLGLSMVYGFIRQSGGRVDVASRPGAGTKITFYLPRLDVQDMRPRATNNVGPTLRGGGEHILLVEDDDDVREITHRQLRLMGYHVSAAENSYAALALIEEGMKIDLLITDVMLPGGINGDALAAEIKRTQPDLRVLFVSGYPKLVTERYADLRGHYQLLQKPFQRNELAYRVRSLLESQRNGNELLLDGTAKRA